MKRDTLDNLLTSIQSSYNNQQHRNRKSQASINTNELSLASKRPWRCNGKFSEQHGVKLNYQKDLDNWEILRINMSKRSYQHLKQYKGLKIPSVGRLFSHFGQKDKNGQLPYLYESISPKIDNLRQNINNKNFQINTVKNQYFGFNTQTHKKHSTQSNRKKFLSSNNSLV